MKITKFVSLCVAVMAVATMAPAKQTTAPNILMFIADDMGPYLGCYGETQIRTPNMDAIAKSGVRFDNAWVSQASCSSSRSSILTGLYPHQNGQIGLAHLGFSMSREFDSIPSLLNKAGYYTGLIGKLHVNPTSSFPFDVFVPKTGKKAKDPAEYVKEIPAFLKNAGDKPYFLAVSFKDPHRPFFRQVNGYPANPLKKVDPLSFAGKGLADVPSVTKETADYFNGIMRVDDGVGMVMDLMKKSGRLKNTIIIIIGDHGAPFVRAKISCYNPGMRIPFIVKWPGVNNRPGATSDALVGTIDILPTLLDAAGADIPAALPGHSLKPVVADTSADLREYMFGEFTTHEPRDYYPRRTVRDKRYQLIVNLMSPEPNPRHAVDHDATWPAVMEQNEGTSVTRAAYERFANPPRMELYDLQNDPDCFINLAGDPKLAEVKTRLADKLHAWRVKSNDPLLKPGAVQKLGEKVEIIKNQQAKKHHKKKHKK